MRMFSITHTTFCYNYFTKGSKFENDFQSPSGNINAIAIVFFKSDPIDALMCSSAKTSTRKQSANSLEQSINPYIFGLRSVFGKRPVLENV